MRIGILGDAILDIDLHSTPRANDEGAKQCFTAARPRYHAGGAANVAQILMDMGVQVTLFAAVGRDAAGEWLEEWYSTTVLVRQRVTNQCVRTYCNDTLVFRQDIDASGEPGQWLKRYPYHECLYGIPPTNVEMFDGFVFSDYAKGMLSAGSGCDEVVRRIIESGVPTVVDPHIKGRSDLWAGATVATPNILEHETLGFLGTQWTTVTRGNIGVGVYQGDDALDFHRPVGAGSSHPQIVGAGDAFTAAMAKEVALGADISVAARRAMEFASAYVCRERGAPSGIAEGHNRRDDGRRLEPGRKRQVD